MMNPGDNDLIRRVDALNAIRKMCILDHLPFKSNTPEGQRTMEALHAIRRVPRVHLDRSAWEPCAKCRSCFSCSHVVESVRDSTSACFSCEHMDNFKPMNFCQHCGRPLTDTAWGMLEKRLEGQKDAMHSN